MSKLIHIDAAYKQWIQSLSNRYRQSQIKAAVHVNREMLAYYWELGHDIVQLDAENRWGSGFMRMLSQDLKEALPEATGLTRTNLYYCKKFYLLYSQKDIIFPQVGGKLSATSSHEIVPQVEGQIKDAILPQVEAEIPALISAVPWGHHKYIMDKCQNDVNKALFYVRQTVENGWSRAMLFNWMDSDLYARQGKALTNFSVTLPADTSDLAREITHY